MANEQENRRDSEYHLEFRIGGEVVGYVTCSRPGVQLIDFYRTSTVLAKDVPPVDKIEEKPI